MKNKVVNSINTEVDFSVFMQRFKKKINNISFPDEYKKRTAPKKMQLDNDKIAERELVRDNIFANYYFDIYEYPFLVFYENNKIKNFKSINDASLFCGILLDNKINSILILVMNYEIECRLFRKA